MDIRNPRPDETGKIYNLWQKCFNDPKPFADYLFGKLYRYNNTICIFEGESLLSALQIYYHTAIFMGKTIKTAYIAGVSTYPRERGKGYCSILMAEAEKRLIQEGIDIITLIPFNFSFYERYGYHCVSYLYNYSVKSENNKKFKGTPNGTQNETVLYTDFIKQFDFAFLRDDKVFSEIYEDVTVSGGSMYKTNGGYMYMYPSPEDIYVPEIIYENEDALFFMLSHINESGKNFTIRSGINLLPYFSETDVKIEIKPHLMVKELKPLGIKTGFNNYINMLGWV